MSLAALSLLALAPLAALAETQHCVGAPNCFVRNREACVAPHNTCGPCFAGFEADVATDWANTPCERPQNSETASTLEIPVIDLAPFQRMDDASLEEARKEQAEKVFKACTGPGFLYVVNHGIGEDRIKDLYAASADFFARPLEDKLQYAWNDPAENSGYVRVGHESLDEDNKEDGDPKESYDMNKKHMLAHPIWSKNVVVNYWKDVNNVKNLILTAFSSALGLPTSTFLVDAHDQEWNTLRLLHYPPHKKSSQLYRAGPHTDYGSMTLLLQDGTGGLEVFHRELGTWVPVPPKKNTMIVNVADLFMRWTNDNFASTLHRVVSPKGEVTKSRYSVAYFVNPNQDFIVNPEQMQALSDKLDATKGEKHYEPISSLDYLVQRLSATYSDPVDDAEVKDEL